VNESVIFARNKLLKQIVCLYLFALICFALILDKQDVIVLVISLTFVYLCSRVYIILQMYMKNCQWEQLRLLVRIVVE